MINLKKVNSTPQAIIIIAPIAIDFEI